jgi:hypothetical protein
MKHDQFRKIALLATGVAIFACASASAYETGYPGYAAMPGVTIPGSAALPSPGIYGFNQTYTRQSNYQGPGASKDPATGDNTTNAVELDTPGLLIVPGWTVLGATYGAVIVQPFSTTAIGAPKNIYSSGMGNTYIAPAELSWKLGDSGFFVKAGLGISIPDGAMAGSAGLSSAGHPWWTIQPELMFSYIKDGWILSANSYYEISTTNTYTGYHTGDILRLDWQATKKIDRWTIGPVGYYYGQLTDDTSSSFYHGAINLNRFNIFAAGFLAGYDFGRVSVNVWATRDLYSNASGGHAANLTTPDTASVPVGWKAFLQLNFRIYAFDHGDGDQPKFASK